jgi:hypothetical protein
MKLIRVQSKCTMTPMYHMYKNRHMEKFKRFIRHIKMINMNRRLFWMHLEVHEVDPGSVHVHHDPMYHMYTDRHMEKFKRVIRHIKMISMNRRLFWMHLEVHEVDQGAVHVHRHPHVPHVQGQAHTEV